MPSTLASLRQLQCVDPSPGFLRVAFNTLARKLGVSRYGFCPGWLVSKPSIPAARKRSFQRIIVGLVVPKTLPDNRERGALVQHQNQLGAEYIPGRQRARLRDAGQFALLLLIELDALSRYALLYGASTLVIVTLRQPLACTTFGRHEN